VHCPDFEVLVGLSILLLITGALVERTEAGVAMLRGMDRATQALQENTELMFRVGCGFFFVAIWATGGILLTPELKTNSNLVGIIQLGIAAGVLYRRTMPVAALGIAALFAIGIREYGAFHLADYPVFLGVAAYLALSGLQRDLFGIRPIDVVRWSAAITLMWASVEKWAYPEWTLPLFIQSPSLSLGLEPEFFIRAAGAVEFALAFALLWTPLVRRVAALVLATAFIGAVFEFGKIDLIGHTLIVIVLLAIVADACGKAHWIHRPWVVSPAYASALVAFVGTYYMAHAALFGSSSI
jgi:hypothetical protein